MTDVLWPAADVDVPNMRQILSAAEIRELIAAVEHVLTDQQARGANVARQAVFVAHSLAPRLAEQANLLADARLRARQAGAALAESVRVADLAHRRAVVGHRLRAELYAALPEAQRFRTLTEQSSPVGLHTGWFAPSNGVQHPCPWCLIAERTEEVERLRAHIAECHRLQNNVAAVVGVETDWDAAGRKAVLDGVCRMSGNLADARMAAESGSDGGS
jgi:hypothetical protein